MSSEQQQLEAGIRVLEAQRGVLGDAVVDIALAPLKAKLDGLTAPPAPARDPAQALKQVSILFLDVVGSTTLSQHLDPEEIGDVMDDALARGTALVEAHRGKVLQYAGDNILAAFGSDEAREDNAERAVQCGLALLALGKTLGAEVLAAHGHAGFDVRVGIHTGGVLLGGGVDADGSIRGIAVNIAARMEQTAPAGALRISGDTYAQVRGLFEVEVQAPLAVKGVDVPVQSCLVLRAKPRAFRIPSRGIEGVATRMIGRDVELGQFQAAYGRLFDERRLAAVTVVAEAGIGKSRLLHEFEAWREARPERCRLFRGRATPATGTQAYGLLRDIVAWRLQIADDDSLEAMRRKMEEGIVPLFVQDDGPDLAEAHAHLLGHLIGFDLKDSRHLKGILDDPAQIRSRAFHAAAQMFRRVGERDGCPVILQLEDLHWADDESLDFLNHLCHANRDVPMLVLGFTRPTLYERWSGWCGTEIVHLRIDLQPLGKGTSRMLADELLQQLPEIPAALRELLTGSAEGNPFYMEELVKMLIDQGAIQPGDPWRVDAERLLVTKLPPTLTGVLQARLDGLPAPEKRALQQASIVGAVFWDRALAAIEPQAAGQLPALVRRRLTLPSPHAPLEGLREYAFHHHLLHQVTYDTVLRRYKREGHARVAHWLADLAGPGSLRSGDFLGLAAEHFEQAGDAASAAEFHARAAEQASGRMAHERVLAHVGRSLALLGEHVSDPGADQAVLRWRLLKVREKSLDLLARRDEQLADLDALNQLAERLDDDHRRAEAAWRRGYRAMRMADWAAMEGAARRGLECATRAGDDRLRLQALRQLAAARVRQGDVEQGQALAQQGLAETRRLGLRDVEGALLNTLVIAAGKRGDLLEVLELERQSTQIDRETGHRINEAIGLLNLGAGWLKLGDLAQAQRDLDAALQMARAHGDKTIEGATLGGLSTLALRHGEPARALALARQSLDITVAAQARDEAVIAALRLGEAELSLGRPDEARQAYAQARAGALEIEDARRHDASAGLAQVALAAGDDAALQDALRALQPVLDAVAGGDQLEGTDDARRIELTCHQALSRAGDPGANAWLARAHGALMAQADAITDPAVRQGFLRNIPWHRDIVAAWVKPEAARVAPTEPMD